MQSHPRWMGHSEEFWQNVVHRRRRWQPAPVLLPEPHEQCENAKRHDTKRWTPPGRKVSVNPKGNHPWMFTRRTDSETEYFGHLLWRADSLVKILMLGKTESKRRMGRQRMRWLDSITDSMDMNVSKLWETVEQKSQACCIHGATKSRKWCSDWTATTTIMVFYRAHVVILMISNTSYFFPFMNYTLMSNLRSLSTTGSQGFSLMFSSKTFIASCFIFKSIIHFEVIFTERIRLCFPSRTVMLKITQARLQQYVNCELPDIQAGFEKAEEPEIKLPTYVAS